MDGIGGRAGWAWIFILVRACRRPASLRVRMRTHLMQEGLFTILMGVLGFFLVPSTPRDSKFLSAEEKE